MKGKKKLDSVLIVDDNIAANFVHQKLLKRQGCVEHIHACTSAEQALNFIKADRQENGNKAIMPNLLLLDLNMPGMSGWDFLEEYQKLNIHKTCKTLIFVVTTSINPDDVKKAETMPAVTGFLTKPLSSGKIQSLLEDYFGIFQTES